MLFLLLCAALLGACSSPAPEPVPQTPASVPTAEGSWLAFDLRGAGVAEVRVESGKMSIDRWELPTSFDGRRSVEKVPRTLELEAEQTSGKGVLYRSDWPQPGARFHLMLQSPGEAELLLADQHFWLLRRKAEQFPKELEGKWATFKGGKRIGEIEFFAEGRWVHQQSGREPSQADLIPLEGKSGFSMARKLNQRPGTTTPWRLVHYNPLPEGGFLGVTEERWEFVTFYRLDKIPSWAEH